jgi:hypothetical protein
LTEIRGLKISLFLAHTSRHPSLQLQQAVETVGEEEAVGSIAYVSMSVFAGIFALSLYDIIVPASALQNLPDYKLYVRTLLQGRPQEPYLVDGFPPFPKDGSETTADRVIRTSRARYGQDRQVVEQGLNRFLAA